METKERYIELYPGHWLYNAGVIGFLSVLKKCGIDVQKLLKDEGTVEGDIFETFEHKIFHKGFEISTLVWQWLMASGNNLKKDFCENSEDPVKDIWGTLFNVIYRGFYNANSNLLYTSSKTSPAILKSFLEFTNSFFKYSDNNPTCSFCMKKGSQSYKNRFSSEHYKELGGSDGSSGMPNSFWNNEKKKGTPICDTCSFILLCRHLSFTVLNDWTKIFINAPSFRLMYNLNSIFNSSFIANKDKDTKSLLAMSIIEHFSKSNITLGVWSGMNIEIVAVTKRMKENGQFEDVIENYSLPYSVIETISNRKIAELLSNIGEFKVLNLILKERYDELVELSYRILKISMKEEYNKGDQKFINDYLFLSKNKYNKTALRMVSNKILKLYALIEERIKSN